MVLNDPLLKIRDPMILGGRETELKGITVYGNRKK